MQKIEPKTETAECVDMGPMNWSACVGLLVVALENGTPAGRKIAREELAKMATAADRWNENASALIALVNAARTMSTQAGANSVRTVDIHALRAALAPFAAIIPE